MRRLRSPSLLLVFAPVLLQSLTLFLTITTAELRYQYALTLSLGFLASLALLQRTARQETGARDAQQELISK